MSATRLISGADVAAMLIRSRASMFYKAACRRADGLPAAVKDETLPSGLRA